MNASPVLTLQLRRLGDLILTFPLLLSLKRRYPENPPLVVAEPAFYKELAPVAPGVSFLPPEKLPELEKFSFQTIINLSNRTDANAFMGKARARSRLGISSDANGSKIDGFWQLYLAALTHNNRHNTFHWSDLYGMDLGLPANFSETPIRSPGSSGKVALFIGASEAAKRPEVPFWTKLASLLLRRGLKPILLGGPAEKEAGARIAREAKIPANFCGSTTLAALANILKNVDLLITPDTGPMHLADWLGTPVLNLSLGNVQAAETGPRGVGQWILRPAMSCYGCWNCERSRLFCKDAFSPALVARVATEKLAGKSVGDITPPPGLRLLQTAADELGLRILKAPMAQKTQRDYLDDFWRAAFLYFYDEKIGSQKLLTARDSLTTNAPAVLPRLARSLARAAAALAPLAKRRAPLPDNFWRAYPAHFRLFAGFIQMDLQNSDYSKPSLLTNIGRVAALRDALCDVK